MRIRAFEFAGYGLLVVCLSAVPSFSDQKPAKKTPTPGAIGLKGYHGKVMQTFSMTPGFGRARMPRMFLNVKDDVVKISLSELDQISPLNKNLNLLMVSGAFNSFFGTGKFANITGYVRLPEKSKQAVKKKNPTDLWQINAVDLVGLMNSKKPVVYKSNFIWVEPLLKKNAKGGRVQIDKNGKPIPDFKREPDMFEWAGIDYLEKGNDVFVYVNEPGLRMLGALRATQQCTRCHSVKQGELLGALSYTMKKRN